MAEKSNAPSTANSNWIISATQLQARLATEALVLVDCRFSLADPGAGYRQYQQAHIPGAFFLDLERDLSGDKALGIGRHPLPNPAMLAEKLASIGIDSTPTPTPVVIYDDNRFAFAARCWWLLRYLGHANIQLLDGGFAAWRAAGFDVTSSVPTARRGNFQARVQQGWTVDHAEVAAISRSGGAVLIDSREPPRFRGEVEPIDPVAGHIPGAVNFSWQEVTDEQGFVTAASQHNERWRELAGADKVVYCGSGVTACVNLLSLELAGLSGRLYPGSWSDWCQREGYPVER